MGLDITSHGFLVKVDEKETRERYKDGLPEYFIEIRHNIKEFAEQSADLIPGLYLGQSRLKFRAGSYSGFNSWRDNLARFMDHASARALWENPQPGPFVELINFSDCEGLIGPKVAAKLMVDFLYHRERAQTWATDSYWLTKYDEWLAACLVAARAGCIEFH